MLAKKTVFVIGAGASYEVGLPLGDELRSKIARLIDIRFASGVSFESGDYEIYQALKHYAGCNGLRVNDLLHKCWLIRDALPGAISIDNLVDAHRNDNEIAHIGKLAIAKSILAAERASLLYVDRQSERGFRIEKAVGSWLIPLFQKLTENVAREDAHCIFDNVEFVVFNYDRCLEYFLPRALQAYYGLSEPEANELGTTAKIYHPYGQVGGLAPGDPSGVASFGDEHYNLIQVSERIRTFSEGLRFESHREIIKSAISNAENLVFLGFAFHPINMSIISIDEPGATKRIFGTTLGIADAAVRRIREDIFLAIKKRTGVEREESSSCLLEVNLENRGANDFLYAHFRSLD